MRQQKKPTFAIHIRFSHFAPLISLPRTLFAHSQTLYKPSADADPGPQTPIPVRGRCFLVCRHYIPLFRFERFDHALLQVCVCQYHGRHRFDDRHRTRQHARVVASLGMHHRRFPGGGHRRLVTQ